MREYDRDPLFFVDWSFYDEELILDIGYKSYFMLKNLFTCLFNNHILNVHLLATLKFSMLIIINILIQI